jgi:hypothetical protein
MNAEDYWWQGNELDDYDDNNNDYDRGAMDPPSGQKTATTKESHIDNQSTQQNPVASTAIEFVDLQAHDSHSDRSVDDDNDDDDDDYDNGDD